MSQSVLTLRQVATELDVADHVARYAIRKAKINPIGKIGAYPIYDASQLAEIRAAIAATDRRRNYATS